MAAQRSTSDVRRDPAAVLGAGRTLANGTMVAGAALFVVGGLLLVLALGSRGGARPIGIMLLLAGVLVFGLVWWLGTQIDAGEAALREGPVCDLHLTASVRSTLLGRRYRTVLRIAPDEPPLLSAWTLYTRPMMFSGADVPVTVHGSLEPGRVFVAVGDRVTLLARVPRRQR